MDPDSSSICSRKSSSLSCCLRFWLGPNSQSRHRGRHSSAQSSSRGDWPPDEALRVVPAASGTSPLFPLDSAAAAVVRDLRSSARGRIDSTSMRPACRTAGRRAGGGVLRGRRGLGVARPWWLRAARGSARGAAHSGEPVKKARPSDWARRNRRSFWEGAGGSFNAGGGIAGGWARQEKWTGWFSLLG